MYWADMVHTEASLTTYNIHTYVPLKSTAFLSRFSEPAALNKDN